MLLTKSAARLCEADMRHDRAAKRGRRLLLCHASTASRPQLEEYLKSIPHRAGTREHIGRTLLEGKVIHLPDVLADPEYQMAEAQHVAGFRTGYSACRCCEKECRSA